MRRKASPQYWMMTGEQVAWKKLNHRRKTHWILEVTKETPEALNCVQLTQQGFRGFSFTSHSASYTFGRFTEVLVTSSYFA